MSVETDVTLIIKTFERPACVQQLITSIRQFYSNIHIIVVDDSKNVIPISGVEYHTLSFASGNSMGRNFAVSQVQTKYFMTLDDDFIFTSKTNLQIRYDILENTDIDIVGTNVQDGQDRQGMLMLIKNGTLYRWNGTKGQSFGYPLYDYVPQCFMARTHKFIEAGGWDSDFVVWDHLVLFVRLLNKLNITMLPIVDILHKPTTNEIYKNYRWGERLNKDRKLLHSKYDIVECEPLKKPPGWEE